jgi:hypothetical protein|tara:strand:- start:149 stop:361 length:213 start_codon:yes stop_codon:yes gene_type:complete
MGAITVLHSEFCASAAAGIKNQIAARHTALNITIHRRYLESRDLALPAEPTVVTPENDNNFAGKSRELLY